MVTATPIPQTEEMTELITTTFALPSLEQMVADRVVTTTPLTATTPTATRAVDITMVEVSG